jgi:hypothetical protein
MGEACNTNGANWNTYRLLLEDVEGTSLLGRQKRMWVNTTKMNLAERVCAGMDWIERDHDSDQWRALVNTVMNFRIP